ncbi:MAG: hypothetical protein EXR69_08305 [Myxococcales bacterium]|nr:hypothetical protein [Myxococcales bacterium]
MGSARLEGWLIGAVLPVLMLGIWALRAVSASRRAGSGGALLTTTHPSGAVLTLQAVLRGVGFLPLSLVVGLLAATLLDVVLLDGSGDTMLSLLAWACVGAAFCFPEWIYLTSRVLPVRVSYALATLLGLNWTRSHLVAGAVILVARSRRLTDDEADWLIGKLRTSPHCYALTWVAAGAVRANRDDLRVARFLFGIAGRTPPMSGSEPARRMAREWLFAEALDRGAWSEAREWATRGRRLPAAVVGLKWVVDALEEAEAGPSPEADSAMSRAVARMVMQRRFRLAARLRREVRGPAGVAAAPPAVAASGAPAGTWQEVLGEANALHDRAKLGRRVEDVQRAGAAWDRVAASAELRCWANARRVTLRVQADVVDRMVEVRVAELAEVLWRERWFPVGEGAFGRATDLAMERAWPELKDRARAAWHLAERVVNPEQGQAEPVPYSNDAFLAWEPLRALAEAMLRDRPDDRSTIFQSMHSGSLHLAVVLYNARGFKYFGNMVFRWLRQEGDGVATHSLTEILDNNIKAGL